MMFVDVRANPKLWASAPAPQVLWNSIPYAFGDHYTHPNRDLSPDGKHFVMIRQKQEEKLTDLESGALNLNFIENFFTELKKKVPGR